MSYAETVEQKPINHRPFLHARRLALRAAGHVYQTLFTRTTVQGVENVPEKGPLLVLPSYLSDLDPHVIVSQFPYELEVVAQGEFKNTGLKNLIVRYYQPTLVHRGSSDRDALKSIKTLLDEQRMVMMFPSGGMWEKPLLPKPGPAYLSQITGAPILPVGIGGTYLKSDEVLQLKRPRITVNFGEVMPPVPQSKDRRSRRADLESASMEIMRRIYDLLPREDQARYDRWGREQYSMQIEFAESDSNKPIAYDGVPLAAMSALAEFVSKPNLFRPMWKNADLKVDAFRKSRFFTPDVLRDGAQQMLHSLTGGDFETYLPYRLGNEKAAQVIHALEAMIEVADWAEQAGARIKLTPRAFDPEA